jgi:hypothetical protein
VQLLSSHFSTVIFRLISVCISYTGDCNLDGVVKEEGKTITSVE